MVQLENRYRPVATISWQKSDASKQDFLLFLDGIAPSQSIRYKRCSEIMQRKQIRLRISLPQLDLIQAGQYIGIVKPLLLWSRYRGKQALFAADLRNLKTAPKGIHA